jgi:hypothetical protein
LPDRPHCQRGSAGGQCPTAAAVCQWVVATEGVSRAGSGIRRDGPAQLVQTAIADPRQDSDQGVSHIECQLGPTRHQFGQSGFDTERSRL